MSQRSKDMALRNFNKGTSLLNSGQQEKALKVLLVAEKEAKDAESTDLLINTLQAVAEIMGSRGDNDGALTRYMEASALLNDLAISDPSFTEHKAVAMNKTAALLVDQGDAEQAAHFFEDAVNAYDKLLAKEPNNVSYCSSASSALNDASTVLAERGNKTAAKDGFERALKLSGKLIVLDPLNSSNSTKALMIQTNLANLLYEMELLEESKLNFESAYGGYYGLLKNDESNDDLRDQLVSILDKIILILLDLGEFDRSTDKLNELKELLNGFINQETSSNDVIADFIPEIIELARKNTGKEQFDDARSIYGFTLNILNDLVEQDTSNPIYISLVQTVLEDTESLLKSNFSSSDKEDHLNTLISSYENLSTILEDSDVYSSKLSELHDLKLHLLLTSGRVDDAVSTYDVDLDSLMSLLDDDSSNTVLVPSIESLLSDLESDLNSDVSSSDKETHLNALISNYDRLSTILDDSELYSSKLSELHDLKLHLLLTSGRVTEAVSSYDVDLDTLMSLLNDDSSNTALVPSIESFLSDLESDLNSDVSPSDKETRLNALISNYDRLSTILDDSDVYSSKLSELHNLKLHLLLTSGRVDDAVSTYDVDLDTLMSLLEDDSSNTALIPSIESFLSDLESLLDSDVSSSDKETRLNDLISNYDRLSTILDDSDVYSSKLSELHDLKLHLLLTSGRVDDAVSTYDVDLDTLISLLENDSSNTALVPSIESLLSDLESLLDSDVSPSDKETRLNALISNYDRLSTLLDDSDVYSSKLSELHDLKLHLLLTSGRVDDAVSSYDVDLDTLMNLLEDDSSNTALVPSIESFLSDLESLLDSDVSASDKETRLNALISNYDRLSTILDDSDVYSSKLSELSDRMIDQLMLSGRYDEVRSTYGSILNGLMKELTSEPSNNAGIFRFRTVLSNMESLLEIECEVSEKESDLSVLISMYERLSNYVPSDLSYKAKIADLSDRMGSLLMHSGRNFDAQAKYETALAIRNMLIESGESPNVHEFGVASIRNNLGTIFANDGDLPAAKSMFESSLKGYVDLFDKNPENAAYQYGSALTLNNLAKLIADMGRYEDAKSIYESALQQYVELLNADSGNVRYKKHASRTLDNLGSLLGEMGRDEDCLRMHEAAKELMDEI